MNLGVNGQARLARATVRLGSSRMSYVIGAALFINRRFSEAVPKLLLAVQDVPSFPTPYRYLAACHAHLGQLDQARATMDRLGAITCAQIPGFLLPLRNTDHRELLLSGQRLAMGEAQ